MKAEGIMKYQAELVVSVGAKPVFGNVGTVGVTVGVGVGDGVATGVGVTVGVGVGTGVGVTVGVGVGVGTGVGAGVGVTTTEAVALFTLFASKVTAVCAKALPFNVAPVFNTIAV